MSTFTTFPITGARLTTYAFKSGASGVTTATSLPTRLSRCINVKDDFGAVGNGVADDAAVLQAALNAAFGSASSPHGGSIANIPVYFPAGLYITSVPLVVTNVQGGIIFGDGVLQTNIKFVPSGGTITPVNSEGITPVLWLNGFYASTMTGLGFVGPSDTTTWSTVCLWLGPDGLLGGTGSHGNLFENIRTTSTTYGIFFGSANAQAVSENTCLNCEWGIGGAGHNLVGFFCSGGNTLNMKVIGGGCSGNGTAGFKTNNSASITSIISVAMDNNAQDIDLAATAQCTVIGVRAEDAAFIKTGSAPTVAINCNQADAGGTVNGYMTGPSATFTGTLSNPGGNTPTLTINSGSPLGMRPGMKVYGSGVAAGQTLGLPVAGSSTVWNVSIGQSLGPISMTAGALIIFTSLGTAGYLSLGTSLVGSDGTNALPTGSSGGVAQLARIIYSPQPGVFLGSIAHVGSNSYFTEYLPGSVGEVFPGQFLKNNGSTTGVAANQQIVSATGNPQEWLLSVGFPTQADVGSTMFPVDMKTVNDPTGGSLGLVALTDRGSPGNVGTSGSPAVFTMHPIMFEIDGSGSIIADGCTGSFDSIIKTDGNSIMFLRGCGFFDQHLGATSADLFTHSYGLLQQYDVAFTGNQTIANLPTPTAGMVGLRMFVTDYNTGAAAIAFHHTVLPSGTYGGSNTTVGVICTGSDWVIG